MNRTTPAVTRAEGELFSKGSLLETGFDQPSFLFSLSLFISLTEPARIWYRKKAVIKEHPTTQLTKETTEILPRNTPITGRSPYCIKLCLLLLSKLELLLSGYSPFVME